MKYRYRHLQGSEIEAIEVEVIPQQTGLQMTVHGRTYSVDAREISSGVLQLVIDGSPYRMYVGVQGNRRDVSDGQRPIVLERQEAAGPKRRTRAETQDHAGLMSTMPGQVLKVLVSEGDTVQKGQTLLIVEAMKMEHEIKAPALGKIRQLHCVVGAMVGSGVALVDFEPSSES